jgi:ketosteroid isomerase-like protein
MSATDNRELVQKLLAGGDPGAFVNAMSDGVQWTVMGTTVFSGTYKGKNEVLDKLMGPLMGQLQSPGRMVIDNIVAEGDYVVVQARAADRMTTSGKPYNNTYCLVLRVTGGQVVQVDEYCDTELITAAFGS